MLVGCWRHGGGWNLEMGNLEVGGVLYLLPKVGD